MKSIRALLVILFFASGMRGLYSTAIYSFLPMSMSDETWVRFVGKLFFFSILIFVPLYTLNIEKLTAKKILGGLPKTPQMAIAVLYGIALLAFSYSEEAVEIFFLAQIDIDLAYSIWSYPPTLTAQHYSLVNWIAIVLGAVFLAPFAEEFFFRGLLLQELDRRFGRKKAVLTCSALFTLLHYANLHVVSTLVFSLLLCNVYMQTKSVWICTIMHGVFNAGALIVENIALENIVRTFEELPLVASWKFMFVIFLLSSCVLRFAFFRGVNMERTVTRK